MHKNKTFWFFEMNIFLIRSKLNIVYTGSVFYNVILQPDIIKTYWKNTRETHFKIPLEKFDFLKKYYCIIILLNHYLIYRVGPIGTQQASHSFFCCVGPEPSRLCQNGLA
jgi:hypothetical protein